MSEVSRTIEAMTRNSSQSAIKPDAHQEIDWEVRRRWARAQQWDFLFIDRWGLGK